MCNDIASSAGFGARKYPVGLQSFREIREGGYVYVDKTEIIHRLVETGKYYFLSRPRRFGKSLLVDTMEELFSGSEELFRGLWIHDKWDWTKTHPVVHFNFADMGGRTLGLEAAIYRALADNADRLGVSLSDTSYDQQFKELIQKASVNGQVVVLIDDYDKPLIDYLDDTAQLDANRSVMKNFYSVLKGRDEHIRLLFMTGVSRFSRVSVFSDLNNLNDITIHRHYATIAGITQNELERDFSMELAELAMADPDVLDTIRQWYNGYLWHPLGQRVYNPFSLLKFMESFDYQNYWYTTGTPTFLFEQLKQRKLGDMDGVQLSGNALADFNTDRLDMASLLFQTGYLTIRGQTGQLYELSYPNREVRESLLDGLLNTYREPVTPDSLALVTALRNALGSCDTAAMIRTLDSLIGQVPYDHWRGDTESIFTVITVLTFRLAGMEVHTEVHSAKGRCDVLVKTDRYIYVMELKLDGTAQEALDQIISRHYLQPYTDDPRIKIALGISFSSADRAVAEYLVREL